LGDRFPAISASIGAELALIDKEIALRAAGKSKPSKPPAPPAPFEWEDPASLDALENTMMLEDDSCEN